MEKVGIGGGVMFIALLETHGYGNGLAGEVSTV